MKAQSKKTTPENKIRVSQIRAWLKGRSKEARLTAVLLDELLRLGHRELSNAGNDALLEYRRELLPKDIVEGADAADTGLAAGYILAKLTK